jgi:hypothetical protein
VVVRRRLEFVLCMAVRLNMDDARHVFLNARVVSMGIVWSTLLTTINRPNSIVMQSI